MTLKRLLIDLCVALIAGGFLWWVGMPFEIMALLVLALTLFADVGVRVYGLTRPTTTNG